MNGLIHNAVAYTDKGEQSVNIWEIDEFLVNEFFAPSPAIARLQVFRKNGRDGIGWDEMQNIKNRCGFESFDAVEFFPSQDAVINQTNSRHLFILKRKHKLVWR